MFLPHNQKENSEQEPKGDEDLQFCWGLKKGHITFYESFKYDDIEYSLYDCVYMWRDNQPEPDIGKLVRIWETESREKKVEVVWFFRPVEIANWLGAIKPLRRELFLACGHGKGLSSAAPLEAISGKCNVLCSSKLKRNPQPTEEELRTADYIFYRTFDVGKCSISEKFPSSIGGIEVDHFFNTRNYSKTSVFAEPKAYSKVRSEETPVRATKIDQTAKFEKVARRYHVPDTLNSRQINNSTKNGPSSAVATFRGTEPVLSASNIDVGQMKKTKVQFAPLGYHVPDTLNSRQITNSTKNGPSSAVATFRGTEPVPSASNIDVGQMKKRKVQFAPLAEGRRDEKRLRGKDYCMEKKDLLTRVSLDDIGGCRDDKRLRGKDSCMEKKDMFTRVSLDEIGGCRDDKHLRGKDSCMEKKDLFTRVSLDEIGGCRDDKRLRGKDSCMEKKDLLTRVSLDEKAVLFAEKRIGNKQPISPAINYKYMEITRKPGMDSSKWFKLEVWDEKSLREMNEKGTLVFLENLDPTLTSADVEDIVWCVFEEKVKAKMVQRTALSSPHSGQAFAIFKSNETADNVVSRLSKGCLVLGNGKPIVGRRISLSKVGSSGAFAGHLSVDRTRPWRQREEMRNAVSTSHFCQSNTIEHELAIQWRLLQRKSELWWTALYEEQGKEIEALMKKMKTLPEK